MSNDKVTSLKLITGEEIICTVVSSGDTIEIKKPLVLSVQQVGQGQFGLALSPWALSNPDIGKKKKKKQHSRTNSFTKMCCMIFMI